MKFIDLTGKKFGRLFVKSLNYKGKRTYWNCVCDCGVIKKVDGQHLRSGKIISCGCSSKERISILNKTHGKSNTKLYNIWINIKTRCYNKKSKSYHNYGERGIIMCKEWRNDYCIFEKWAIENGYQDNLTIDRIDNNGNYEPSNCRWVDRKTQSNNTRSTILLEFNGEKYSAKQLCEYLNINYKKFIYGYHKFKNIYIAIEYSKKYKKKGIKKDE